MTDSSDCTVFMGEKKAMEEQQSRHITVAHFPKPYIWFAGLFITVMLSSVGALFAYVYQEGQANARQDARLEMMMQTLKSNSEKLKEPRHTLKEHDQDIDPMRDIIASNKAEINGIKEQTYQQNREIQSLLNKILGDIGELKGQIK